MPSAIGSTPICSSASEAGRIEAILAETAREPMLTVTDLPRPLAIRGIVHLETVGRRPRFAADAESANQAGLSCSAKLLSLAGLPGGRAAAAPARRSGLGEPSGGCCTANIRPDFEWTRPNAVLLFGCERNRTKRI